MWFEHTGFSFVSTLEIKCLIRNHKPTRPCRMNRQARVADATVGTDCPYFSKSIFLMLRNAGVEIS